jgi:hypothetical protein
MIKNLVFAGICGIFALTACANNSADRAGIYQESGNTINVNDQRPELYNETGGRKGFQDKSEDFGYVRTQRSPVMKTDSARDHYAAIDREQLAKIISELGTNVPHVNDVSALVTDEEVFIVYNTDSKNRMATADQVKKTALSVVPRWYHVYVSDNTALRREIENFATLDSDSRDINSLLDQLAKKMSASPQGQ